MKNFDKAKILCIGDLILDCYAIGEVDKISPEAPIPIFKSRKKEFILGGAGNVAINLSSLGAKVTCAGVIGNDHWGKILLETFHVDRTLLMIV